MHQLAHAFKTFSPLLIEPAKAKAYLDKVAELPVGQKAGADLEDMMELMFGEQPQMVKVGGLAVIPVKGIIGNDLTELDKMMGSVDVEDVEEMIENATRDPNIKVILFDFNSPGGTVTGVPELAKRIRKCPKKTIGWTCSQSCSGSMWLMSQCDEVFVSPSSVVGSVGVYIPVLDESKAYADEGYRLDLIKSGWAKGAGFPGTAMTPEQRALFETDVKDTHDWFIADILAVRTYANKADMQGQCWSGRKAADKALVDGTMDTLDDLLMYLGSEIYASVEQSEQQPEIGGAYGKAGLAKHAAEVTPEKGEEDGVEPVSTDDKDKDDKKKKKKGDDDEEMPDVPDKDCPPIDTDKVPKP